MTARPWWRKALLPGILVTAAAVLLALRPGEPVYRDKRLGQWLADLDFDSPLDKTGRDEAVRAVRAIGTNALPPLTEMLCTKESFLRRTAISLAIRQSWFRFHITPASRIQSRAVQGYKALGPAAATQVPMLMRTLEQTSSPQVRAYIALALGNIGPSAKAAVPILLRGCTDPDAQVRQNCLWAVANIGRKIDSTEPIFR